jgi:hypothetical protein
MFIFSYSGDYDACKFIQVYVWYPTVTHQLLYTSKEKHGATDASSSPLSTPQDVVAI